MSDHDEVNPVFRKPVYVSLGCHLDGAALPHPDCWDPLTAQAGVVKRLAFKNPDPNAQRMARFGRFVDRWLKENMVPLPADVDCSVDTWLNETNYPKWRKEQLRVKWEKIQSMENLTQRDFLVKSFMKDEGYSEWKHGRGINSRTDEFKCAVGPIFKLIEKALFKNRHFIKYVPVSDRPRVIRERLQRLAGVYVATDYTSFESMFTEEFMQNCEFKLYEYMTRELPQGSFFMGLLRRVLGGANSCMWRWFTVLVHATRMSGEMCTSLGNGFSNLMLMLFLAEELSSEVDGFVEGDDGIFSFSGVVPTKEDFASLGATIKLEVHNKLSAASFCGIVFDEVDQVNLTDPLKVLAKFGFANHKYAGVRSKKILMLLRCKSLSLAYQCPQCPILQSLAWYGLRVTHGVRNYLEGWVLKNGPQGLSEWEREWLLEAIRNVDISKRAPIGIGSRQVVESLYGISIDYQIKTEDYLDNKADLSPLCLPDLLRIVPVAWTDYWNTYMRETHVGDSLINEPVLSLGTYTGWCREW
jgi:hypothetical protein